MKSLDLRILYYGKYVRVKETSIELFKAFRRHWLKASLLLLVALLCNLISLYVFGIIQQIYLNESVSWTQYNFSWTHMAVMGAVVLVLVSLILEAYLVGWEKSGLNYLLNDSSQSRKADLFYFFLYFSNLSSILGFLFTLGLAYWGVLLVQGALGFVILKGSPYLIQFAVQLFIGSFVFFLHHYIAHTSWLWEVHKVHHASERMNMVNNFRRHPFEHEFRLLIQAIPGVMLGISPEVILVYAIFSGLVVVWQHSDYDWQCPFIEKYIFIGAAAHRIHHSKQPKFYQKNFGYLVLWDWLFGTLERHKDMKLEIGIVDKQGYNVEHPLREIAFTFIMQLKVLLRKFTKFFGATGSN